MIREPQFETVREHAHDFLELFLEEKQKLKERVEKWHGLVRMFIHPMYEKWRGKEKYYANNPEYEKIAQIEQALAKLLVMPEEKTPPIIIMEEAVYIKELQKWLKENPIGSSQNGVYFIRTASDNPTPWLAEANKKRMNHEETKKAWERLIRELDDCGVKKILMGGMQLEVAPIGVNDVGEAANDWTGKEPFMAGCVGIAMSYLSKDKAGKFEVELSALTDPSSERKEFNDFKRNHDSQGDDKKI